jgi:hypothetical protein
VERRQRCLDHAGDLFLREHGGQLVGTFWVGSVVYTPAPLQDGDEQEPQRGQTHSHTGGLRFADAEKIGLIVADVVEAEPVGRAVEVLGNLLDGQQIRSSCSLRVITTLEFIEHHFA